MKTNKNVLLLVFSSLLILTSCASNQNEDDGLITGHPGMFRCDVDGEEWIPERPDVWTPFQLQYYSDTGFFELYAKRKLEDGSVNQSIFLGADSVSEGTFQLNHRKDAFIDWKKEGNCAGYDLNNEDSRLTILEINTETKSIKGEFEFTVYDPDCEERLVIENGEFDLAY